ncbi:MAG: DNA/RNA nuclease SfsA [Aquificae bacterium]|nr:DNA/RNA nuclease SfsA [Aquificota bacterium]
MEVFEVEGPFEVEVVEKLNRFVVLVRREGRLLRAHNTNTGRLRDLLLPGRRAYCLPKSGQKTDCRLFAVEEREGFAVIDTALQMRAFEFFQKAGLIPWLSPERWQLKGRNRRVGNSLIDYLFEDPSGKRLLLEVKSAAMRLEGDFGGYPDCPTERGRKHLRELLSLPDRGGVLFIVALPRVKGFRPFCAGDPEICSLLKEAKRRGLLLRAISLHFVPERGVVLENPDLPVEV